MKFTKMHGIGNDYVYVNGFVENIADPPALARQVADRHFGIGADGLILILPSDNADVKMRMYNADGSEGEMCGNGIRCVAKYAFDRGLTRSNPMKIETGRGVLSLALDAAEGKVRQVTVNMGQPILELPKIPADAAALRKVGDHEYALRVESPATGRRAGGGGGGSDQDVELIGVFVSMGNPHAVFFCKEVAGAPLALVGPLIERHRAFPRRINAHFVQVHSRGEITMRTWERGSGITLACGTGACAVCVAGVLINLTDRRLLAHLPGGDLLLEWREADNNVYMTGPATEVFTGEWPSGA